MYQWPVFFLKAKKAPAKKAPAKQAAAAPAPKRSPDDMSPEEVAAAMERIRAMRATRERNLAAAASRAVPKRVEPWDIGSVPSKERAYDAEAHRRAEAQRITEATARTRARQQAIRSGVQVPHHAGAGFPAQQRQHPEDPRTPGGMARIGIRAMREASFRDRTLPSTIAEPVAHPAPHTKTHEELVRDFITNNLRDRRLPGVSGGGAPSDTEIADAQATTKSEPVQLSHLAAFYRDPVALPPRDRRQFAQEWKDQHKRLGLDPPPVPEHQVFYGAEGMRRHQELAAEALSRGETLPHAVLKQLPAYMRRDKVDAFNAGEFHKLTPGAINQIYAHTEARTGMTGKTNPELAALHAYQPGEYGGDESSPQGRNFMDRIVAPDSSRRIADWHAGKLADAIRAGKGGEIPDAASDFHKYHPAIRDAILDRLSQKQGRAKKGQPPPARPGSELGRGMLRRFAQSPKVANELRQRAYEEEQAKQAAAEQPTPAPESTSPAPGAPAPAMQPTRAKGERPQRRVANRGRKERLPEDVVRGNTRAGRAAAGRTGRVMRTKDDPTGKAVEVRAENAAAPIEPLTNYAHNPYGLGPRDFRSVGHHNAYARSGNLPNMRYLSATGRAKVAERTDDEGNLLPEYQPKAATPPAAALAEVAPKRGRGRPRKEVPVAVGPKRGRGRPPKVVAEQPAAGAPAAADPASKTKLRGASKTAAVVEGAARTRRQAAVQAPPPPADPLANRNHWKKGLLHEQTHGVTGSKLRVYDASQQGIDAGTNERGQPNKYAVVCEKHHTVMGTNNLKEAQQAMRRPAFCPQDAAKLGAPTPAAKPAAPAPAPRVAAGKVKPATATSPRVTAAVAKPAGKPPTAAVSVAKPKRQKGMV